MTYIHLLLSRVFFQKGPNLYDNAWEKNRDAVYDTVSALGYTLS